MAMVMMVMMAKAISDAVDDDDGSVPLEPMRTLSDLVWGGFTLPVHIRYVFLLFQHLLIVVCLFWCVYCFLE